MSDERVRLPRLLQKALESDNNTLKERARLHPLSLSVELNLYPLSRATMVLPETDPVVQMHDFVEIYGQNGSLGIYRVVNISTTYKRQRQVQLNHALDVFNDAILPGEMTISGTVAHVLAQIIAGQTASLGNTPYWMLGTCEDTNQYSIDLRFTNAMQCLTDLAKAEEDYYFTFDFSRFPWRINFVARNDEVLTEFRLPRNVESCQVNLDDTDLCTKLYLSVDTTTTSQDGDTTTTTHEIHENPAGQAVYGVIAKTAGISAERTPDKAEWVRKYFERHGQPGVQITINGREINRLTGATLDEVHLGRICRVALPEYNDLFNERIVSAKYPDLLRNPSSVTLSLANKKQSAEGAFSSLSSQTASNTAATKANSQKVQNNNTQNQYKWRITDKNVTDQGIILREAGLEIDAHGVWAFAKEEGALGTMQSDLRVQADAITTEVSRATDAEDSLSSRITQTADQIALKVSKGDVATQLSVECGNVTISTAGGGTNLVIDGYITSQGLITTLGNFSSDIYSSGNITGKNVIGTTSLAAPSLTLNGEALSSHSLSFLGNLYMIASDDSINLAHYHAITATENNGVITITQGAAQDTAGSASFNIADTQFYRDAVASATAAGKAAMGVLIDQANQSVISGESAIKSALIASTVNLIYNTSNHKYTATTAATANGTTMHTNSAVSGTEAYVAGESAGFTVGYSEGVNDGYKTGWNAAVAAITRDGNSIIGPKTSDGSSYTTETKYTANYTPSAYTQETHRYTPSTYVAESHSYTPSDYTRETTVYNTATVLVSGSSHSHSSAYIRQDSGSRIYNSTTLNLSGDHSVQFVSGSDSYTKETTSTIGYYRIASGSSYTPSTHSYTASVYDAETHSYTPSSYTGSSFSWS